MKTTKPKSKLIEALEREHQRIMLIEKKYPEKALKLYIELRDLVNSLIDKASQEKDVNP